MKKIAILGLLSLFVSQVSLALDSETAERAHQFVRTQRKFEVSEASIHDSLLKNYNVSHEEANQLMDGSHSLLQSKGPFGIVQPTIEITSVGEDDQEFNPGLAAHPADVHHPGHRDSYEERLARNSTSAVVASVDSHEEATFNPGLAYHPMDDAALRALESLKKGNTSEPIIRQKLEADGFGEQEIDEALAQYNEQVLRMQQAQEQKVTSSLVQEVDGSSTAETAHKQKSQVPVLGASQEASELMEAGLPGDLAGKLAISRKLEKEVLGSRAVMLTEAEKVALKKYFIKYDFEVPRVQHQGALNQQERDGLIKAARRFAQELLEEMDRDRSLNIAFKNRGVQGILGDKFNHLDLERRQVIEETVQSVMHSDFIEKVSMIGIPAAVMAVIVGGIIATAVSAS